MDHRDMPQPAWSDQPSPRHGTFIPVLRAKPGLPVTAYVLSARVQVVWVHWMGQDGTQPHFEAPGLCPGCIVGCARRQYGYLACWHLSVGRYCLVEIPNRPLLEMWSELAAGVEPLRGKLVTVRRMGDRVNSQVQLQLVAGKVPAAKLPEAFDVRQALLRLWGLVPGHRSKCDASSTNGGGPDVGEQQKGTPDAE